MAVPLALAGLLLALALHPAQGAGWVVLASPCTCLLAAVLLVSSAQVRRAEALAAERTAQWEAQVQERLRIEGALRETEQTLRRLDVWLPFHWLSVRVIDDLRLYVNHFKVLIPALV